MTAESPPSRSLRTLAAAAADCHGCELFEHATQTVFGAGPRTAQLLLVGEQPGDVEDRRGEPFVGPAGRLLDRALAAAGIDRGETYVTNAVKHFRWKATASSQRRLHQRPDTSHITACRPWLAAELAAVRPRVVVAMGTVAAASLFGPGFRVTQSRGVALPWPPDSGPFADSPVPVEVAVATVHPSSVLRGEPAQREELLAGLVSDLRVARGLISAR